MIGQIVGNYKIEQKLGEGGMGEVYRGVDMMLEREVAIKFLRPELASQANVVERFRSEAVTLAKLNHPNIATLYSFMRQGDSFIMVLEFVRGVTLDNVIQRRGAIPCEQAIPIFCQMLDGIQEAHNYGIIHRDIKPANMMLTEKGTLKVLDFGIARILGTARMTRQGNIIGTIEYMSPEQVRGFETDARSDIYSLGMLLYEMLTARCPFDIQNEFELMKAQIEQYPVPPRQLNPAIPEVVEQAIWRSIQKDPAQRFQSASEFRAFLLNAGFAATGRIEPLAVGDPNAFGTRPPTQPSGGAPSPYATVPMQPGYNPPSPPGYPTPSQPGVSPPTYPSVPTPSQPGVSTPSQPGITTPSRPGLSSPTQPGAQQSRPGTSTPSHPGLPPTPVSNPGVNADPLAATLIQPPPASFTEKETRISAPGQFPLAQGGQMPAQSNQMKETRIGAGPVAPVAPPQAFRPQQPQPAQQSAKKSTWIYFVGAGVAAVVIIGLLIGVGAFVLLSRPKPPEPVRPASLTDQPASKPAQPAEQPTQQVEQPTQPTEQQQPAPGATDQTTVGTQTGTTTALPVEQPAPRTSAAPEAPSQRAEKKAPSQSQPQQRKPADNGAAAAAAERERKRKAALNALDQ
jgi:serine/threonine-protein kinase